MVWQANASGEYKTHLIVEIDLPVEDMRSIYRYDYEPFSQSEQYKLLMLEFK